MRSIFFDSQSSTPVLPEVWDAMRPYFIEEFGSPSSLHERGLRARDALGKAREQCAELIDANPDEVLFTSGGTEAANLAVKGTAWASRRGRHIVAAATEHPAVLNSLEFLQKQGFTSSIVPVDSTGRVAPERIASALTADTILVCVQHVNHEIGTVQPLQQIAEICDERNIPLFVDATASAGWLPVRAEDLGASLLAFSPHRFFGPKGVGVLYRKRRQRLAGLIHGGSQEEGRRAGTENLPAIVGAGFAAAVAQRELPERAAVTGRLQNLLWEQLRASLPDIRLNGPSLGPLRSSTNLNVSIPGVEGEGVALSLDMQGIAVGTGPSCISKSLRVSHVLTAIGLPAALAKSNIVFSLTSKNTEDEVRDAVSVLSQIVQKLRSMSPEWDGARHREKEPTKPVLPVP